MSRQRRGARLLAPAAVLGTAAILGTAVATAAILREDGTGNVEVAAAPLALGRTVTLATAAGDVAVFVSAQPGGPVELVALTGQGSLSREALEITADGHPVELAACGRDCFRFAAPTLQGLPTKIAVAIARAGKQAQHATVVLPARLPPSGDTVLARAKRVMKALRSLRYRETLTAGLGPTVVGQFRAQAPDRLRIDSNLGEHIILIGDTRWIATNGRWSKSSALGTHQPAFPWEEAAGARVLGRPRLAGGRGWLLAVRYPGPDTVWFRLLVAPSGRVHDMVMIARAHFMTQHYSGFNQPVLVEPPSAP